MFLLSYILSNSYFIFCVEYLRKEDTLNGLILGLIVHDFLNFWNFWNFRAKFDKEFVYLCVYK